MFSRDIVLDYAKTSKILQPNRTVKLSGVYQLGRLAGQIPKGKRKKQQPSELITEGRQVCEATKRRKVKLIVQKGWGKSE